jgi:predicted dithiol-disulfide oxidoreductase (DUF899 family)
MGASTLVSANELSRLLCTPFPGESAEYREARRALLAEEIEFRRHMTRLTEQRRALPPGPVIEKDYRFKDANGNEVGLRELFGDHDTLVTYFWMYGPQRERPCPMHQLARRRERQWNGHRAALVDENPRSQHGGTPDGFRGRARLAASRFRTDRRR